MLLGIDTGGTFTDFVWITVQGIRTHKIASTPQAPEQAILQGIADLGIPPNTLNNHFKIIHGSTVATNAVLENKGARTVYISNRGLKDCLTIGRQNRQQLYNLQPHPATPPVPAECCLETGGRLSAAGEVVEELDENDLEQLVRQVSELRPRAVAINLLFSFIDDRFERLVEKKLKQHIDSPLFISRSSDILPEYKEYERGITTWLNASVGPVVHGYLKRLQHRLPDTTLAIMQSSGRTLSLAQAAKRPVNLLLSGPAGGLNAALFMGKQSGYERLLTFDMGGTSTDVAQIDQTIRLTSAGRIACYPVGVPMVDMHTIGAGGGSIASIDAGNMLRVGPESAGASPGPACYGKGGQHPTVTDANLVLGRLHADTPLADGLKLDTGAAEQALQRIATPLGIDTIQAAQGIIDIANEHMAQALRGISIQRGIDPRQFILTSFGGAGGLHVCALADMLEIRQAMIPAYSGILSALGMLVTAPGRELSKTLGKCIHTLYSADIDTRFTQLSSQGIDTLRHEGLSDKQISVRKSVDMRYAGQGFTLNLPWTASQHDGLHTMENNFHQAHRNFFGHQLDRPVELVNLRVSVSGPQPLLPLPLPRQTHPATPLKYTRLTNHPKPVPVFERSALAIQQRIDGPAIIQEPVATSWIATDWYAQMDKTGNLVLQKT